MTYLQHTQQRHDLSTTHTADMTYLQCTQLRSNQPQQTQNTGTNYNSHNRDPYELPKSDTADMNQPQQPQQSPNDLQETQQRLELFTIDIIWRGGKYKVD